MNRKEKLGVAHAVMMQSSVHSVGDLHKALISSSYKSLKDFQHSFKRPFNVNESKNIQIEIVEEEAKVQDIDMGSESSEDRNSNFENHKKIIQKQLNIFPNQLQN